MYVCTYVCMYVRTYVRMYVRMYVCMYVRMYVCIYVHVYVRMYVSIQDLMISNRCIIIIVSSINQGLVLINYIGSGIIITSFSLLSGGASGTIAIHDTLYPVGVSNYTCPVVTSITGR